MQTSTLFIGNITQIDYAYIDPTRLTIKGGSLNLSVEVTGAVEPIENVVVDFGTIKKSIKNLIDDKEDGFDHKLWVSEDSGMVDYTKIRWAMNGSSSREMIALVPQGVGQIVVSTPQFTLVCPKNAIRVCKYENGMLGDSIRDYLEEKLNTEYPNSGIKVKVFLTDSPTLPYNNQPGAETSFTYVHGLKNSTSWGCQNIAHGHKSWLMFLDGYGNVVHLPESFRLSIKDHLDGNMFVWCDNIVRDSVDVLSIEYNTPRGYFYLVVNKASVKTHVIDTETTVEYLAEWFVSYFEEEVKEMMKLGATSIYFSEGLVKGARIRLKERFGDDTI